MIYPKSSLRRSLRPPRDAARLMVLSQKDDSIQHRIFHDLPEYLEPGDLLVVNNSKVLPARIVGIKQPTGAVCELLLLRQDLLKLDLYGTIRGAVSTFDTFNHIPDLDTAIANAAFFMEEGGVFLFDMNTPYKHQKVLGENVFTFEEEDAACVWRNHYHPADRRVEITVDIDYRETGEHFHEQFYEYTYDLDTIRAALEKHGFVLEKVCDGESFGPLTEESERYFFCAVKQYTQLEEKENV
mgnify:CR=1 FL=1